MIRSQTSWILSAAVLIVGLSACDTAMKAEPQDGDASKAPPRVIPSVPEWSAADSRRMALEWLLAHQNPDGSWGTFHSTRTMEIYLDTLASHRAFHGATTALCAQALIEPARTDPAARAALDRAVGWVLESKPIGTASGGTFYDVWAHTYLIDLGVRLLEEPGFEDRESPIRAMVQREVDFSFARQSLDGGWGYYDFQGSFERPTGNESTSFNTAALIVSFDGARRVGIKLDEVRVQRAIKRLELLRLPDGAFVYGTYAIYRPGVGFNRPSGTSGRLQVCHLALYDNHAGGVGQAELAQGLGHLRDRHHYIEIGRGRPRPHEAFYSNSGYYYFFGHYYASRVIGTLEDQVQRESFRVWLDDLMRRIQFTDGSWFDYPLYGYGHAYGTGFGLLTMQQLQRLVPPALTTNTVTSD